MNDEMFNIAIAALGRAGQIRIGGIVYEFSIWNIFDKKAYLLTPAKTEVNPTGLTIEKVLKIQDNAITVDVQICGSGHKHKELTVELFSIEPMEIK